MQYLFLAISLIVLLFILFRYFKKFKINSFHAVVVNYYVCILTGFVFLYDNPSLQLLSTDLPWVRSGIFAGILFVPCFYLMALTVEKVNVTVAAVSNKMSLVIPILFSLFFLRRGPETVSLINISGIFLALIAIVLTSVKPGNTIQSGTSKGWQVILPASVFILGGIIDTVIHYTNYTYLKGNYQGIFPLVMFASAAASGTLFLLVKILISKKYIRIRDIAGGILLGIPNYFSLYFLVKTLSDFENNAALVFPVLNIGIIVAASLMAVVLFNEKLSKINLAGICFSIISVILVFW